MPTCNQCGAAILENGTFCPGCGKPVSVAQVQPPASVNLPYHPFEFRGSGLGYFWLMLWTVLLTAITLGLFFPWAYCAQQRWIMSNTFLNGRPLRFEGSGLGFFGQWLVILILTAITLGIYGPWGYCQFKRWETSNTSIQ